MRFKKTHLKQLESLAATGMPGAYKVFIFFLIQHFYSTESLGNIATWISASQIIGFFTAIGWAALVVVRVSKAENDQMRLQALNSLALMSITTLIVFISITFFTGKIFNIEETSTQICYWTIAWTSYQIPRHYFIALAQYRRVLGLDSSIIALSTLTLTLGSETTASDWLALAMFTPGLLAFIALQFGVKPSLPRFSYDIKGLEFGLTNFFTGGVSLSLIPLAAYFEGKEFAGVISLYISITAVSLLLPRALALKYLPQLSKNLKNPEEFYNTTLKMKQKINISNIFSAAASALIALFFTINYQELSTPYLTTILILLIAQNTISTNSLTDSNILMAQENSRSMLIITSTTSTAFFTLALILCLIALQGTFLYLCLTLTAIVYYRALVLRKKTRDVTFQPTKNKI